MAYVTAFAVTVTRSVAEHHHRACEIVHHRGVRGTTTLRDGRSLDFAADSVVVYPPFQHHAQTAATAGEDLCLHVALPAALRLDRLLHLPPPLDPWCRGELASLMQAPARPSPGQQVVLDHRASAVFMHLLQGGEALAGTPLPPSQRLVERAKELLQAEYREACRLSDIARRLGVGADHLRHAFTAATGAGPHAYLTAQRLERARNLLANTSLPLAAIAAASGFATARYFCSVFRRQEGCTPTEFRRRC